MFDRYFGFDVCAYRPCYLLPRISSRVFHSRVFHSRVFRPAPHLTPMLAMSRVSSEIPPGRSLTVTTNRHSRPSVARPRSRQRPSTVVSMLPPHSGITTLYTIGHDTIDDLH